MQMSRRANAPKPLKSRAVKWSGRQDSNLRPSGPKPDALPDCATPRKKANQKKTYQKSCGKKTRKAESFVSVAAGEAAFKAAVLPFPLSSSCRRAAGRMGLFGKGLGPFHRNSAARGERACFPPFACR